MKAYFSEVTTCPYCGEGRPRVSYGRQEDRGYYRHRICDSCGQTMNTVERLLEEVTKQENKCNDVKHDTETLLAMQRNLKQASVDLKSLLSNVSEQLETLKQKGDDYYEKDV